MEGGGLVIEHHVVRAGDAHDEVDPGHTEQREQHVHVVLIGLCVVGVADVAAHRQAQQLAAEVVFQAGADDLFAVIQVLRADKADHGIHQKWLEVPSHCIGAGLAGLLVEAMVSTGGQRAALAGFEIHQVVAEGTAFEAQAGVVAFLQDLQADAEAGVGRLGAGNRLEHQIQRHATVDRLDRGGDVGQHTGLGGDFITLDDAVEHLQHVADRTDAVGGRVDADHGVAVAVQQAVENAGGDAGRFIGRVIRLQASRHAPAQADGIAKTADHADFLRHQYQVLHAHDLRYRRRHFRRQAGGEGAQAGFVGAVAEQPVAKAADGQVADRGKGRQVMAVDDQPGDFIGFVGNQRLG